VITIRIHQQARRDTLMEEFMGSIRLRQGLAVAVTIQAALLVAGVFGLGLAIQQGAVEPPTVNLWHSGIGIVAYRTHYPDCPPYTQCPPQSVAPPQEYYVSWSSDEPPTADQPYGRTARRLLVVPLQR
jgi:hypothetical protein